MTIGLVIAWLGALLAALPLAMLLGNLRGGPRGFAKPSVDAPPGTGVSVLIPARDEEHHIGDAVTRALASRDVDVDVVVLDDQSSDRTAAIVREMVAADPRVRLLQAGPPPPGWAGKQFACRALADAARHDVLMFVDADVRLTVDAATRASGLLLADDSIGLVSGFPRERTESLAERVVIPWIHILLLGYLPMARMRTSRDPAFGAGCGQWMVARRGAYLATGGHGASPQSRHDGLTLPRTFRRAGWRTDLFDGTDLADCRMYASAAAVWQGFGKSAGEGMATPRGIVAWTLLLGFGHVVPWLALAIAAVGGSAALAVAGATGVAANVALRLLLIRRLRQSRLGALLHPFGALCVLAIQWQAVARHLRGRPSSWKGRRYSTAGIDAKS